MVSRRSLLFGLGGATAGAGAILNTGAFSTVEAERVASVETSGDASAFLQLVSVHPAVTKPGGTIQINLDGSSGGAPACDSATTIADMVQVTNQGTQTVQEILFGFSVTGANQNDGHVADALHIVSGGEEIDATETVNLLAESDDGGASDGALAPGESFRFGMLIDLLEVPISCIDGNPEITLTIIANTTSGSGSGSTPTPTETSTPQPGSGTPSACPLDPSVAVSVGQNALGDQIQSGDIDLTGTNNDIDGDVITQSGSDGDIDIADTNITGRVEADSEIGTLTNTNVGGTVRANGGDIGDTVTNSEIGGDVITASGSDGDIDIDGTTVAGKVEADGGVGTLTDAVIGGTVRANGGDIGDSVTNSEIGGDLITASGSDGDIDITNSSVVCGNVIADGDVGEISDSTIGGNVESSGDIDIGTGSTVFGNVTTTTDGDVVIANTATVKGNISAGGDVTVNGTVEGDVSAGGSVDGSGTIQGTDPR